VRRRCLPASARGHGPDLPDCLSARRGSRIVHRVPPAEVSPDSTYGQDVVTAVLVAHDGAAFLARAAHAVASQTRPVQRVVAVDTGSRDRSGAMLTQAFGRGAVFGMERTTGYGAAVARALRHRAANTPVRPPGAGAVAGWPQQQPEWLWLIHDDCEPAPDALERLLLGARRTPGAAVLGPKIRDWSDREVLLEAGTTIDRAGRRITGVEPREVDQGQHDGDRDVLAVSSAGMLVRREVWEQVGGFDPGLRLFWEDTDFCWRVHAAGHRVRVITDAVIYHAEASARNRRPTSAAPRRRRQDRASALLTLLANLPPGPMISALAGNLVLSALRTLFFLVAKRPAAALDEAGAVWSVVGHPFRLLAARRRRSAGRRAAYSRLRAQLPAGRSVRRLAEFAASALSRSRPAEAVGSHHASADPLEDDSLLVDSGLAQRLLTSPGVLLFLGLTVIALVAERSLLGPGPLGGGALAPAWGGASGLWQEYLQGFHPAGIGSSAATPPYVALLAALATLLGGKPWLAVDLILLGCVPLAGATAFAATRHVTGFLPARLWAAVTYALAPASLGVVAAGHLGSAVVLILLPVAAVRAGRSLTLPGRRGRRAAWAAAGVVAVMSAFVPLVWVLAALVMAAGGLAARRRAALASAGIVAAVPLVLLLPWAAGLLAHPARLLAEAGLAGPGLASPGLPARSLLLLSPGGPGVPPFWVMAGVATAAAAALAASGHRPLVLAGWGAGVIGLVAAAAVSRAAVVPAGASRAVVTWPGTALVLAGAGLVLAAAAAGDRIPGLLRPARRHPARGLAVVLVAAVACSAPAMTAAFWLKAGVKGPVSRSAGPLLPEFVEVSSDSGARWRTLVLRAEPGGVIGYQVLRDTDPLLGSSELAAPVPAQRALARAVAILTAPAGGEVAAAGPALARLDIAYVLLPAPVSIRLAGLLDGAPGLRLVSETSGFRLWRVLGTVARVTVTEPGGRTVPLPSGPVDLAGARAPASGGTLVLAEPAGGWSASLNGRPLAPLAAPVGGWAQGFRLPPGGGSLTVTYDQLPREVAVILEGLAVLLVAGLALPGGRDAAARRAEPATGRSRRGPARHLGAVAGPGRSAVPGEAAVPAKAGVPGGDGAARRGSDARAPGQEHPQPAGPVTTGGWAGEHPSWPGDAGGWPGGPPPAYRASPLRPARPAGHGAPGYRVPPASSPSPGAGDDSPPGGQEGRARHWEPWERGQR
jgi:GT2 family glycosyltransferase